MDRITDASIQRAPLDRQQVEGLFRSFYGPVKGYFRGRGLSEDDALELAQTTFLKAAKSEGPQQPGKEKAWIFVIAANVLKSHWRDQRADKRQGVEVALQGLEDRGEGLLARSGATKQPQALEGLLLEERREKLRQAIADLPAQRRACFEMYLLQERKYSDIATILCIEVGTVKSQIFEARKTLKKQLGSTFGVDSALNEGGTS